ncbi:unnamed protein product [Fusarium langsethiae]|nr:unnamed protein product [Fusarium langsethiae]
MDVNIKKLEKNYRGNTWTVVYNSIGYSLGKYRAELKENMEDAFLSFEPLKHSGVYPLEHGLNVYVQREWAKISWPNLDQALIAEPDLSLTEEDSTDIQNFNGDRKLHGLIEILRGDLPEPGAWTLGAVSVWKRFPTLARRIAVDLLQCVKPPLTPQTYVKLLRLVDPRHPNKTLQYSTYVDETAGGRLPVRQELQVVDFF